LTAQEKLRLEKLRIQEEKLKAREIRRQKLAQLGKERQGEESAQNAQITALASKNQRILTSVITDDLNACLRTLLVKLQLKQNQFEKSYWNLGKFIIP